MSTASAAAASSSSPSVQAAPRRTNCGKPLYRFGYAKNTITLATPCFEPTCNTCAWQQPGLARFDDSISPRTTAELLLLLLLRRRSARCVAAAAVEQQLRRLGDLHVRNAPPVKARGKRCGAGVREGAGAERRRVGARRRRRIVLRFVDRADGYRELVRGLEARRRRLRRERAGGVVLKFERVEEFARLSRRLAAREAEEGKRLFLVIGKGDSLRCEWR